jgi:hypothetical protein
MANESLHLSTSDSSSTPATCQPRKCKTKGQPDVARNKESYRVESSREQPFALTRSPLSPQIVSAQKSQLSILLPHPPTCPLQHKTKTRIQIYRQDSKPGDQKDTSHNLHQVIYGLLHEHRIRHIRRDRAEQDRSQHLPRNCWRPVENRVQLRKLGLATGGWPTVRGGRKVGREDRRGLIAVTTW